LELEELRRFYQLYPSPELRWDEAVTQEQIADALRTQSPSDSLALRLELQENALAIYRELSAAEP
jgi:hypothetical protein